MFQNYSQTYAAAITTYVPLLVLILRAFGLDLVESDVVLVVSSLVSTVGFVWQIVQRFSKGDVTVSGVRK